MADNYIDMLEALKTAYSSLLICQYADKPNAIATIKANIEVLLSNMLLWKIRDCWDIDDTELCVGTQLDIIGKWVGVDRYYTEIPIDGMKLAFYDWNVIDEPNSLQGGLQDWNNERPTTDGAFLNYYSIISVTSRMGDEDFRTIIKLKIVKNNTIISCKNIDDAIYSIWQDLVYTTWENPMEVIYNYDITKNAIIELARIKNCLPYPTGCKITLQEIA